MATSMKISNFSTKYFGNNQCITDYLNDIRGFKVPTTEESEMLVNSYKNGDQTARDEMIVRNQRFIYSLAKIYAKNEDEVMDYVSEGNIGLIQAFDQYDPSKGVKFLTFAVWYVRRAMNYYFATQSDIVARSNNMKLGKKIDKVKQKFYAETGSEATDQQVVELIKKEYDIDVCDISDVYDVNVTSISDELSDDYTVEDNDEYNTRTASTITYEDDIDNEYNNVLLTNILSKVPQSSKEIICYLFGVGSDREHTVKETAEYFGVSATKVTNVKNSTMKYLRDVRYQYKTTV